jgi:Fur family zinc uptake transcriptional regulator
MSKSGDIVRTKILELLQRRGEPLSAYDVLRELSEWNPKIAPPTVYRALAALETACKIHRVESLKAYMACQCDALDKASILSICGECGIVEENVSPELLCQLSSIVGRSGFSATRHVIEVQGKCASCDDAGAGSC